MQLVFGERNIVAFATESDFFEALGFLANNNRGIRFDFEQYDNKWGIEGRIWITNSSKAPNSLKNAFSAGTDYVDHRLNCNEFILFLINNFGFKNGSNNTYHSIVGYIPTNFKNDFDRGYNL